MNILSLFDGISCGYLALQRAGIPITNYFSSEIDKNAIQISQKNFPDIIRLGDIRRWKDWDLPRIDLIVGGSPCVGFSFAGKQLNFNDPQSKLFFEFADCVKHFKPTYFLLENVVMKKEYQNVITDILGVLPVKINSALVSAQTRKRLYWFNIPDVTLPKDKGILLKDIIEDGYSNRNKSYCLTTNYGRTSNHNPARYLRKHASQIIFKDINSYSAISQNQIRKNVKSSHQKANSLCGNSSASGIGTACIQSGVDDHSFRKLTPLECERLQIIPERFTEGVSNSARYKVIGNAWTVDVIAHILKHIKTANGQTKPIMRQLSF